MLDPDNSDSIASDGLGGMFSAIDELEVKGQPSTVADDKGRSTDDAGDTTEADRLAEEQRKADEAAKGADTGDKGKPADIAGKNGYPDTIKGEQARKHFDNLKCQKDAAVKEAADLKKRVAEYEAKSKEPHPELASTVKERDSLKAEREAIAKERDDLKKKTEELGKVVALKAIEETDDFKTKVSTPRQEAIDEVNGLARANEIDMGKINEILRQPDKHMRFKAIKALCADTDADPHELKDQINKYLDTYAVEGKLREEQAGNQEFATRSQTEKEAKTRLEQQEEWTKEHGEVESRFDKSFADLLKVDGVGDIIKIAREKAKTLDRSGFDALPTRAKAYHNVAGWAFKGVVDHLMTQLKAAQDITAKRNGTRVGGGHGGGADTEPKEEGMAGLFAKLDALPENH